MAATLLVKIKKMAGTRSVGPLGGEGAGQADNQVRRTAEMVDSQEGGYGVIAEGNVAAPTRRSEP